MHSKAQEMTVQEQLSYWAQSKDQFKLPSLTVIKT
jgi:hypothetical protein